MFTDLATALRAAAQDALPSGVYATSRVFHDAVDAELAASNTRAVNISFAIATSEQITCGANPRWRSTGILYVRLYEPATKGDRTQLDAASTISDALRGLRITKNGVQISLYGPALENEPREGSMWVRSVSVPFKADMVQS